MDILMTNDDGIESEGIILLAEALADKGHTVTVCAPAENQSATSHSITLRKEYRVKKITKKHKNIIYYSIFAKPVDCVQFALCHLKMHPDLLISGINNGMNIGSDVLYSGTVGAACEGLFCGIKSWSVSVFYHDRGISYSFKPAVDFIMQHFDELYAATLEESFLNINIPVHEIARDICFCKLAKCEYDMQVQEISDGLFVMNGLPTDFDKAEPDSDLYYICRGYATVTPLRCDMTDYTALQRLKQ